MESVCSRIQKISAVGGARTKDNDQILYAYKLLIVYIHKHLQFW